MGTRSFSTGVSRHAVVKTPVPVYGIEGRYAAALFSAANKSGALDAVEKVAEVAEENLGMAMVFTIVSEAIQWLGETNDRRIEEEAARLKKIKDEEEAEERKKLEGTKVTI